MNFIKKFEKLVSHKLTEVEEHHEGRPEASNYEKINGETCLKISRR